MSVDKHAEALRSAGEKLFPGVRAKMEKMAYGNWRTMLYESLVRACVIRYQAAHMPGAVTAAIRLEQERGFLWMAELVALLEEYESNRTTYPTLDSFAPRIIESFELYAGRTSGPSSHI